MRPVYIPGSSIDFRNAIQSALLHGKGWSETEPVGVWSDGPESGAYLPLRPETARPPFVARLSCSFLVVETTQRVSISASATNTSARGIFRSKASPTLWSGATWDSGAYFNKRRCTADLSYD